MDYERPEIENVETQARGFAFEQLLSSFEANRDKTDGYIEYDLPYPKEQFLEHLTDKRNFLLHGSGEELDILEPQQANDASKESGNKKAVYAVTDPVFPIFYAIQDRSKINGVVTSSRVDNDGEISYEFLMPKDALEKRPYKNGVVYILGKENFTEEYDDGEPSNEWTSPNPIKPCAKLRVSPEDFPHLNSVQSRE